MLAEYQLQHSLTGCCAKISIDPLFRQDMCQQLQQSHSHRRHCQWTTPPDRIGAAMQLALPSACLHASSMWDAKGMSQRRSGLMRHLMPGSFTKSGKGAAQLDRLLSARPGQRSSGWQQMLW